MVKFIKNVLLYILVLFTVSLILLSVYLKITNIDMTEARFFLTYWYIFPLLIFGFISSMILLESKR